jgi:hypothetical protein
MGWSGIQPPVLEHLPHCTHSDLIAHETDLLLLPTLCCSQLVAATLLRTMSDSCRPCNSTYAASSADEAADSLLATSPGTKAGGWSEARPPCMPAPAPPAPMPPARTHIIMHLDVLCTAPAYCAQGLFWPVLDVCKVQGMHTWPESHMILCTPHETLYTMLLASPGHKCPGQALVCNYDATSVQLVCNCDGCTSVQRTLLAPWAQQKPLPSIPITHQVLAYTTESWRAHTCSRPPGHKSPRQGLHNPWHALLLHEQAQLGQQEQQA